MPDNFSRREWSKLTLAGVAGLMLPNVLTSCKTTAAVPASLKGTDAAKEAAKLGMVIGAQTYSFRDRNLADAIKAMQQLGIKSCELWQGHVEPREFMWQAKATPEQVKQKAEGLKKWRETVSMDDIRAIKDQLNNAGIAIQAYNGPFNAKNTDDEIDLVFRTAKALGTDTITTSTTVDLMKRIDAFAQKHQVYVAMHNHSHVEDANQFATPDSFARGMAGNSDFIRINLDIGHFTAANFDAVDFIQQHHDKISCIHLKDRKKNQGPGVAFGEGDAPLADVLKLIKRNNWPIPGNIEYEYKGADTVTEIRRCLDYCKKVLTS